METAFRSLLFRAVMVVEAFPDLDTADEHGLLAAGGDLDLETLLLAYSSGIFPWPHGKYLLWFSPPERTILKFDQFKASKNWPRLFRQANFEFKRNHNFKDVIKHCAQSKNRTRGGAGTWITPEMIHAYLELHRAGYAESFETYQDNQLCGAVYGVRIGNFFAGESMFYTCPNASKFALYYAIQALSKEGVSWMDCQIASPHLTKWGAEPIKRDDFIKLLKEALAS